jgi:arsenate reductase
MKKNIMFLCTGNSCRSQMAEALARHYYGDEFNFYSAGTKKHGMNPRAMAVINELNIDMTKQYSKTIEELPTQQFDYIFTVCDSAHENCPYYPATKIIHVGFQDPPALTKEMTDEEEILKIYRRVRDEIELFIKDLKKYL